MDGRQTTQTDQLVDPGRIEAETRRHILRLEERLVRRLARRGSWQSREGGQGGGHLEEGLSSLGGRVHGRPPQVLDERC
jgi:hypothetical protein